MNDILNAITTVGFPIVMCGALFWYVTKQMNLHKEETEKLSQALNDVKQAIMNNTTLVQLLLNKHELDK